ncbi:Uncharacterised protein [Shigella sonnei]|nr:Uncharacterised protein [Shigella sonnei]SIY13182.1 Uncharacterised protein [Shigella sonnei]
MRFVQLFAEFLPPFFGIFTQQGQRALILPGGVQFDINIFAFQEAVKVGHLRHHPNGTHNSKRCGNNFVRHTGHHVTAAGSDFVYRNS